ncbi:hypothetical protein ONZ45_g1814 [Pleurotus djamor]|nr:hypothetical protein ONZ45_g1814 [Pleurotus djamor]
MHPGRFLSHILASISLVHAAALGQTPGGDDVVDLGYVQYLGNRTYPSVTAYLGIPYAEPPIEDKRFRAPVPLDTDRVSSQANGTIVDARSFANFCIQGTSTGIFDGAGTEDCLKLNVWAPAGSKPGDNLPVLFYIHGGGFKFGHQNIIQFDHWVEQSPNVVIVSIGYRLGLFGFLSSPSFNDSSNGDFNVGFRDQMQALRWVQKYISSFGGDPNRVTINGQSAGGSSVEYHLLAQKDEQLFHGAIGQSVYKAPMGSPEQYEPLFNFVVDRVGCNKGDISQKMACLRKVDASEIAAAHDSIATEFKGPFYGTMPVLDGRLFTEYPTESYEAGRYAKVPLITGATTHDTVLFGETDVVLKDSYPLLTDEDIKDIFSAFNKSSYADEWYYSTDITSSVLFFCSRFELARIYSDQPSWTYRYNQPSRNGLWSQQKPDQVGHSAENSMLSRGTVGLDFGGAYEVRGLNEVETAFSKELIAYFLSFVRTGNPNTYKLPRSPIWREFTPTDPARVVLQAPSDSTRSGIYMETESENEEKACKVINSKWRTFQH